MRSRYLVKMAVAPATAAMLSSSVGIGLGALINRHKRKKGEEIKYPWLWPAAGGILAATPPIAYGIARNSLDVGPGGERSIPFTKRWFMNDKDFYENSAYASYNIAKRNKEYLERNSFKLRDKQIEKENRAEKRDADVEKGKGTTSTKEAEIDYASISPICDINVNAFNQEIWADAARGKTPLEAAGIVSDTLNQTKSRFGSNFVSPGQIVDTMVNAGVGFGTAWLAGKSLGAMAGLSDSAQKKLQEIGIWGGIMQGIGNSISD